MNEIKERVSRALDEQADSIDGATLSRLRQARARALETPPLWQGWRLPLALSAAISLVAALVLLDAHQGQQLPEELLPVSRQLEVMEIINLEVDLELVEELDFYDWLEQQENAGEEA